MRASHLRTVVRTRVLARQTPQTKPCRLHSPSTVASSRWKSSSPQAWTQHPLSTIALTEKDSTGILSKDFSQPHTAYIALGGNLGDRIGMIETACREMSKRGIKVKRTSSLWETEPMYVLDKENFINGACEVSLLLKCRLGSRGYKSFSVPIDHMYTDSLDR